ncbi:SDR family oxidoreductase [Maribacter sp. 4G9]|uniref:SDR family oxidoreductase n=1 Tax=Maribacter sp. 4G9 TaxID=1889777 RepID=UPI000C14DDA0|nr:SDR family oxidoreductase [Maribacter sp. 4G9]PIB27170.1 NAD(P)-dependent oxidoreductase [Maribacter sp. 4G9]
MILITGATGNYGKASIDSLLRKGVSSSNIVALVRDEEKAADLKSKGVEVRVGDYNNYEQLVNAFKGIDKLLLISGSDLVNRDQQHQNVIEAAKEAGVKHIVYTSFERKNETETSPIAFVAASHITTENLIKSSGMHYTILRNNLYMDLLPWFFGEKVMETGVFLPAGDTKAAFALRDDMAEATANIMMTEGHENKVYNFSNTENVSIGEMATSLSEIAGKEVTYTSPSTEVYIETLTKANVPADYVGMFAGFSTAINQGEFTVENSDLENILGRKPTSAKQFLSMVYASK